MTAQGKVSGHGQAAEPGNGPTPGFVADVLGATHVPGDTTPIPADPLGQETRPPQRALTFTVRDMSGPDAERNNGEHALIGTPRHDPDGQQVAPDFVRAPVNRVVPGNWDDHLPRG